jgi:hypothetical protein
MQVERLSLLAADQPVHRVQPPHRETLRLDKGISSSHGSDNQVLATNAH